MPEICFPMTATGRAGYIAPTTLEDARMAAHDAKLQQRTNDILQHTRDCVEFLQCRDDRSGSAAVVDAVPQPNRDLSPEPNTVLISGSNLNFVTQGFVEGHGGEAMLKLKDGEGDLLSRVERLEVNQADGVRIRMTHNEQGAEVIHYMDNLGDHTVMRDRNTGVLTIMYE